MDPKLNEPHRENSIRSILIAAAAGDVADSLRYDLEREGFRVWVANTTESALDLASSRTLNLALIDINLIGANGLELCQLRAASPTSVPILVLTSRSPESDQVLGIDLGADDYLTKPFAFAELLVRVKALLRRGAVSRSNVLRVADLELDRLSQQVKRAGQRIELTGKEYALLEYLMLNAGRVLSRTMIIEHVWDQSFDGATNIVDVYVRHLRNKVDQSSERKLIRTVRGVGYLLAGGDA